jgi:polyisoprenyl-phosphate glycosyltransferase
MTKIQLSIVTPTFNEELTIDECIRTVAKVMFEYDPKLKYEHIIIDNSSTDTTLDLAIQWAKKDSRVKVAVNDRNIGGTRNIYKGMSLASGEWIVPMLPADLQDPPEVIPKFLEVADSNTNVIFGVRKNRQESLWMRVLRSFYYRMVRKIAAADLPLHSGEFCLISKSVAEGILELDDENPYVRGLIAKSAKHPKFIEYTWVRRKAGESKASFLVLAEVAIAGLVSTSQIPARVALLVGFAIAALSIFWAGVQVSLVLFLGHNSLDGIPTIVTAIFFFGGVQLFFTGLIGEYILSIHRQIKREPRVNTRIVSTEF